MFKVFFYLFVSIYLVHAKHEEYEGHSLYGVTVYEPDQVDQIAKLVELLNLDIWNYPNVDNEGLILVSPDLKPEFESQISAIGATYRIDTENIKEKLDLEDSLMAEAQSKSNRSERFGLSFDVIHRFAVVDRYLVDVANRFPRVARAVVGGRSIEGRDIRYLRVSSNNFADRNRPIVVIQCLLHAREWVTLPVALWAIQELVLNVREQDLIRDIDWIIIPIANPDGYEFSHTRTRMWRKNRRPVTAACTGVDLNRNFAHNWGTASSNNPCSDTFHGARAFSEPESVVTRDIIREFRGRIRLFLDIHSFGSMILFGFANRQIPSNGAVLNRVGVDMARRIDAVRWRQHPVYRVGNSATILYLASGICADYAQAAIGFGNRLSYTYELPAHRNQNNLNGFLVEPEFIRQAGFETWEGIKEAARFVVRNR